MSLRNFRYALGMLGFAFAAQAAHAGPISGAEAVDLVRAAMREAGVTAPDMTAPLRALPDCAHAPRVTPRAGAWAAAELACDAPKPWVRVLRTGSAASMAPPQEQGAAETTPGPTAAPSLLAVRPLPRGKRIGAQDIVVGAATGIAPASRLDDPALAIGRRLRVAVGTGQPLLERHLEPALDVEADQTVTVLLTGSGIEITTTAIATAGGTLGDRIPLRQPERGTKFDGFIIAPGIVRVRPNIPRRRAVIHGKWRLLWSTPSLRTTSHGFVQRARSTQAKPAALALPQPTHGAAEQMPPTI